MYNNQLGKGLSTLIPNKNDLQKLINTDNTNVQHIKYIDTNIIFPSKNQPRKSFCEEKIEELAISIKNNGVIQPIILKQNNINCYEIIAGERRWRASKIAGLKQIPSIITNYTDKEMLELSIIENIQRDDLNCIDEAYSYKRLIDEFMYNHEDIAKSIGKSRSYISNLLRLVSLPECIQDYLKNGKLSMGHARALINVKENEIIAEKIINESLSVRETESLVKTISISNKLCDITEIDKKKNKPHESNDTLSKLEKTLTEKLGMEVTIKDSGKKGSIIINFDSIEKLQLILKRLTYNTEKELDRV